jgi:type IV pilus assembly protein PilY1
MFTKALTRTIALFAALVCASQARAQGDLDILLRTVPPVVMIQLDTSGSMSNITLPPKYYTDRGTGSPSIWYNTPTTGPADNVATPQDERRGAARVDSTWHANGGNGLDPNEATVAAVRENYQRTCTIYRTRSTSLTSPSNNVFCAPGATGCQDDDANNSSAQAGYRMRCWNVPGAVSGACPALVPTSIYTGAAASKGGACTTVPRNRVRAGGVAGAVSPVTPSLMTTIVLPDFSFDDPNDPNNPITTDYATNYLWWFLNEIYSSRVPEFLPQDRMLAAKQSITSLVNQMNVDGQDPKVKFGLARYNGDNGGSVYVPASLNSKPLILAALNDANDAGGLPAELFAAGLTPLSETLVDVARYLAGDSDFGTYPTYDKPDWTGAVPPSPITSQCEKTFVVVVTDGLPTEDDNDHYGTSRSTFLDTMAGYIDSDPNIPGSGGSSYDSLDDVADKLLDFDLRLGVPEVQNAVTYTVGFSLDAPLLEDAANRGDGEYYSANNSTELGFALYTAVNDILLRNATLTAANVPATRSAYGDGFYTAWFKPGGRRSLWPGHLQAFTVNSSLVVTDRFGNPAIDPVTDLFYEPRYPHWDSADRLLSTFSTRTIYTTKSGLRAPFTPAGITAADLGPLLLSEEPQFPQDPNQPDFTTAEQLADAVVSWLHGYDSFDEDDDSSYTDVREFVLGDIFHSNAIAIGPPLPYLRFEAGYGPASDINSFMGSYKQRSRVIYVGANDGMLHAFNAGQFQDPNTSVVGDEYYTPGNGNEMFAYVPGVLLPRVKQLPKLDTGKQYMVDGSGAAADVWIDYDGDGIKEGSEWTTSLLTPLREGGEGMLALDVTDPNATGGNHGPYPRLMWEVTPTSHAGTPWFNAHVNLGQTWSRPIITRVKLRGAIGSGDRCGANNGDGDCREEWVAIFGAGYRPQGDPNLASYTNDPNNPNYTRKGRGVYMVRVRDGSILASLQQDPNHATFSKMRYAIPAEPAVLDLNFDGFADVMYIGDLGGQLWKWDLSAIGAPAAGPISTTVWPAGVVFEAPVATTAGGVLHYHSIFQAVAAAFNDRVLTLSFASGERANLGYRGQADPNDPNSLIGMYDDNNRFWVLKDRTPTGTGAFPSSLPIYEEPLAPAGHGQLTDVTDLQNDPNTSDEGYFFRVRDGEKFMTNHLIFGGNVVTVSYTPSSLASMPPGTCALGGTTTEWAWELEDGAPSLDDPVNVNQFVRSRTIGNGAATDPRVTVSKGPDGRIIVRVTAQTSMGEVTNPDGGGLSLDPVDMIYWRQNF